MMKNSLSILIILSVLIYSCKDQDVIITPELTSTQASKDNLTAENIFNDISRIVKQGLSENNQTKSCPSYNLMNADTSDLDTLIIDFGNGDPECLNNGKIRTGKIIITYTGKYRDSLSIIKTTFDNHYVNYHLIQGEKIITNQGRNNKGNLWFTIDINNASITTPLNGTINWTSNRVKEWTDGEETYLNMSDDKYKITGSGSGNSGNGNDFIMEITDTLELDLSCFPSCIIKSGITKISPTGYPDRIINYGDSTCDCNAVIIINEESYPVIIEN